VGKVNCKREKKGRPKAPRKKNEGGLIIRNNGGNETWVEKKPFWIDGRGNAFRITEENGVPVQTRSKKNITKGDEGKTGKSSMVKARWGAEVT